MSSYQTIAVIAAGGACLVLLAWRLYQGPGEDKHIDFPPLEEQLRLAQLWEDCVSKIVLPSDVGKQDETIWIRNSASIRPKMQCTVMIDRVL